jgi:hypothetical protein
MSKRLVALALAIGIGAVVAFGAGYLVGTGREIRLPIYTGNGMTGADQASLQVGDTWYAFETTVRWTDKDDVDHTEGWPECLPKLQEVKNVRFAGAILWAEGRGMAQIVWVDCRGH